MGLGRIAPRQQNQSYLSEELAGIRLTGPIRSPFAYDHQGHHGRTK